MNSFTPTVSPLRQRMIEDMRMRKLSIRTQATYIRNVLQFARLVFCLSQVSAAQCLSSE